MLPKQAEAHCSHVIGDGVNRDWSWRSPRRVGVDPGRDGTCYLIGQHLSVGRNRERSTRASGSQTRARMSALAQWRYASSTVTLRTRIGSLLRTASGARYSRSVTISNAPVDPQGLVQARHEEHQPHAGALHQVRQRVQLAVSRPIGEQQRPVVQDVGQRSGQVSPRRGVGPPVGPRRADHAERRQGQEVAAVHVQMVQHLSPDRARGGR